MGSICVRIEGFVSEVCVAGRNSRRKAHRCCMLWVKIHGVREEEFQREGKTHVDARGKMHVGGRAVMVKGFVWGRLSAGRQIMCDGERSKKSRRRSALP